MIYVTKWPLKGIVEFEKDKHIKDYSQGCIGIKEHFFLSQYVDY